MGAATARSMAGRRHRRDTDRQRAEEPGRGRDAETPSQIGLAGWKDILWRVWESIGSDRVTLVAAGCTYFLLLALFPAITALVSVYGLFNDPASLGEQIVALAGFVPAGGLEIIQAQLERLVSQSDTTHGVTFLVGLGLALWSANAGVKTLFEAMNVAYGETEKRGFVRLNLITLLFTLGAILLAVAFLFAVAVVPAIVAWAGLSTVADWALSILRWPLVLVAAALALALLYRYGPSRDRAKWRWVTWGSGFAAAAWLLASILFSFYLSNFGNYDETYGSLGAVIGFMVWTWLSLIVVIVGAELNAEIEHQTARDSTIGPEAPLGARGAAMADTVGKSVGEAG